jgi:hypothetical protein
VVKSLWVLPAVLGLLAGTLAVAYYTEPADAFPRFLGGTAGVVTHLQRRADAAAVVAIGMLIIAIVMLVRTRLPRRSASFWRHLLGR